jgi:hypothetical protein
MISPFVLAKRMVAEALINGCWIGDIKGKHPVVFASPRSLGENKRSSEILGPLQNANWLFGSSYRADRGLLIASLNEASLITTSVFSVIPPMKMHNTFFLVVRA